MSVSSPAVSAVKATESPALHVTDPTHSPHIREDLSMCISAHASAPTHPHTHTLHTRHRGSFSLAALHRSSAHVRGHWLGFARVNPTSPFLPPSHTPDVITE